MRMEHLKIAGVVLGMAETNCYIIYREKGTDEKPGKCVIVDPADNAPFIIKKCREMCLRPEAILLTHGHFDHILAAEDIRRTFHAPVCAGEKEAALLAEPSMNLTGMTGESMALEPDRLLRDGETLHLADADWRVIFTPGHTEGSVCYYDEADAVLISGDTLFCESVGRTDLPTGSQEKLFVSVSEKLFALPDNTEVYPGHGEGTTIGHEKEYNII